MAKPFRPKRGTTAQNNAFTGLEYEITLDKDKGSLRVHDGVTAGGAHEILPKDKNDALYAPKDIDVGVTSVNGKTGVVTLDVGVTSVNGQSGAVTITPPDPYVLPAATGSSLGGVKIGSNISNSSGTISLSKANVTGALGYTPLQTAPVTSVNGRTGAVSVVELSWMGAKTYTQTVSTSTRSVTLQRDDYGRVTGFYSTNCACDCDCTC